MKKLRWALVILGGLVAAWFAKQTVTSKREKQLGKARQQRERLEDEQLDLEAARAATAPTGKRPRPLRRRSRNVSKEIAKPSRMRTRTILTLSIGCWLAYGSAVGAGEPPDAIFLKAGEPAPAAGQFWSQENAFELIAIFARTELDLTKSLARIRTLEADKRELQAIIRHEQGKVRIAEQDVVIEKLKCPSLLERKLGWTIGLSGGYNIVAEADQTAAYAGVGACWGWHL